MKKVYIFSLLFGFNTVVFAASDACEAGLKLQDYEPNTISIRDDDNDLTHYDFTISQMYPMWNNGCAMLDTYRLFFSFTGNFGFYKIEDGRNSAPVIGKRFKPKLFVRHWLKSNADLKDYFDISFVHESNGQSIDTDALYQQQLAIHGEYADDYLSRSWNFFEFVLRKQFALTKTQNDSYYLKLNYFTDWDIEESHDFETGPVKSRKEVDGISLMYKTKFNHNENDIHKLAVTVTTGYKNAGENMTYRLEYTYQVKNSPPFIIWYQSGYNADLIDYYREVESIGVGVELRNFLRDL